MMQQFLPALLHQEIDLIGRVQIFYDEIGMRDKIINICMERNGTILHYLSRFTQCQDELGGVGENITSLELVILALLGLPKS